MMTNASEKKTTKTKSTKKAGAFDSAVLQKIVRKAKGEFASADDILNVLRSHESTRAPTDGARALVALFESGRLDPTEHDDAFWALGDLFGFHGASLDVLDPELVASALRKSTTHGFGLDALLMLSYGKSPATFDALQSTLGEPARTAFDSVRARLGEPVDAARVPSVLAFLAERRGAYLRTPTGLRVAPTVEIAAALPTLATSEQWVAAHVDVFSQPNRRGLPPDMVRQMDGPSLVRVMLGEPEHLLDPEIVDAIVAMDPEPDALWAALETAPGVDEKRYGNRKFHARGVLASVAALGFARRGRPVPTTFERHFAAGTLYEYGWTVSDRRSELLAQLFVDALRTLSPERAHALALDTLPTEARRPCDAIFAIAAHPTPELVEKARSLYGAPNSVPPFVLAKLAG